MSAQYPALNSDDRGFDRRYLAAGEVSDHGDGTIMLPTSQRIDWWHKLDQLRPRLSTTPTMAAMTARLWHTGERRPVAVEHKAWEDSGAHPKHARAKRWTGGATEKQVDDHSRHGDEADIDGGVLAAAVEKRINQRAT